MTPLQATLLIWLSFIHPILQKRYKVFLFMLFPWIGCHFSGLGLEKGISFRFHSPWIGLGFKNLCGTPLSKIHGRTSPGILQLYKPITGTKKSICILRVFVETQWLASILAYILLASFYSMKQLGLLLLHDFYIIVYLLML